MDKSIPPRIHVLLAKEAPVGVVIRRGPSKETAILEWDLLKDKFTLGQWLNGRIYERRCDISPDGKYFLYFASDQRRWESGKPCSWTVLSKVPWLKALDFYPFKDCWNGGGLFLSNKKYWFNGDPSASGKRKTSPLQVSLETPFEGDYGHECPRVYFPRLQRNGWVMREDDPEEFEKDLPYGWVLRKICNKGEKRKGQGWYHDEHELIHEGTGIYYPFPDWEWAEWDAPRKRLLWAQDGKIFSARLMEDRLGKEKELYDFSSMKFEKIEAPY